MRNQHKELTEAKRFTRGVVTDDTITFKHVLGNCCKQVKTNKQGTDDYKSGR